MDRPPANAITLEFARELSAVFEGLLEERPRAIVTTGTGAFFCGGLDLKIIPTYAPEEQRDFIELLNGVIGKIYACPIPVVGAVNGHAIAGGFVLALIADYRIGPTEPSDPSGGSLFGLTEARVGIPFPAAPKVVLQAELSPADLRYTALNARNFGAEEAKTRGLFDELQPPGALLARALEVAEDLGGMPAGAYARIKRQFRGAAIEEIERINRDRADPMLRGWLSADARSASKQLLETGRSG